MSSDHVTLTVNLDERQLSLHIPPVSRKLTLTELLRRHDLPLNTRCGEKGLCESCRVTLVAGSLHHRGENTTITAGGEPIVLKACEHDLATAAPGDTVTLAVSARSRLAHNPSALSDFVLNVPWAIDPSVKPGPADIGLAVDIGTTTMAMLAVDLVTGEILGRATDFNRQMHLGDDVLTRINLCMTDPTMLDKLQAAVMQTLVRLIDEVVGKAAQHARYDNAEPPRPVVMTVTGNTTMLHLFAGVDPTPMGIAPFTPVFLEARTFTGRDLGDHHQGRLDDMTLFMLPSAGAYLGADLVGGMLASGLGYDDGPSLLVDVGTNGEIIARFGDQMVGCATAAGPAFEGAGLASGIRAADGAIEHVSLHPGDPLRFDIKVIGEGRIKPIGLCGSAYIDLLAQGRRVGLLTPGGRFNPDFIGADGRIIQEDEGKELRIAGTGGNGVVLAETDVASLMQAKAAIAAGITILLRQVGMKPADVKKLYLAGGFGMHLDMPNAIAMGLLPGFDLKQIQLVGNSALGGAYLALVDAAAVPEMQRMADQLKVIELNLDPEFEDCYIDQLSLP